MTEIRVGILHSSSGPMAVSESLLIAAARMALDEINRTGGVLGRQIRTIVEDGRSLPEVFAAKAEKLLDEDGVATIFGCWTSASRKRVKSVVEAHNSLLWYPVQYEGLEQSPNIVYTGSCLNQQIAPAVDWCLSRGARRIFLVGSDYVFPRAANRLLGGIVEASGGTIVGEVYRPLDSTDFASVIRSIQGLSPDFVVNTINGASNIAFFKEYAKHGLASPVMSFSVSELELPHLARSATEHYACWSYFQSLNTPENRRFLRLWGNDRPSADPLVMAYSQPFLWRSCVESAASLDNEVVLKTLPGQRFLSPAGVLEIQTNHHTNKHALVGAAGMDDQFEVVWASDEEIPPRPWLGVEDVDLASGALIRDALGQYTEFTDLNMRLAAKEAELRKIHGQLEELVVSRTAELERRTEELRRYESIVSSTDDMQALLDPDGVFLAANAACSKAFGRAPDEILGRTAAEILGEEFFDAVILPRAERCLAGESSRHQVWFEFPQSGRRYMGVAYSPYLGLDGERRGFVVTARDITEDLKLEEQLRQAHKMEAVGSLASGIAHDFNNILGVIIGNTELAGYDVGPQHAATESLDEIRKASLRAKDLVHRILDFASQHQEPRHVIQLRPVVEEAITLLRATIPAAVEIAATFDADTPAVLADPTQILQVLINLCTNSWHAMQQHAGRIDIRLDGVEIGAEIAHIDAGLSPGRFTRLRVADNGSGMDAATLQRIFDPFFTTKPVGEGTGLGLSVVHGIVKAHRGGIDAISRPGEGTTFTIYLPAATAPEHSAVPQHTAAKPPGATCGKHVLYLDDEESLVSLGTRVLERLGYRVSGYTSAEEALAAVRSDPSQFDLVVTDFSMPRISGLDVAHELARLRPDLPVVLTSGYVTDELQKRARDAGVREVMHKPGTAEELAAVAHRILRAKEAE